MKIVSKIICWIALAFLLFIIVNLVLWAIQYWWTKNYAEYLNTKDRKESVSQVYLLKPKTWLSIFYGEEYLNTIKDDTEDNENKEIDSNENLSWDNEVDVEINHNPYDPDYEDEFNSFFGIVSEDTWSVIPVQEIENLEPAGFVVDESTEN